MVSLSYGVIESRSASSSSGARPSALSVAWSKSKKLSMETRNGTFWGRGAGGGGSATAAGATTAAGAAVSTTFAGAASTTGAGAGSQSAKRAPGCQDRVCQHSPKYERTGLPAESIRY